MATPQGTAVRSTHGRNLPQRVLVRSAMTPIIGSKKASHSRPTSRSVPAAAAAGTLLLVGRLWDAFFDPMMGVMADRTNTRWGKFRPWVLWTAVPWGVAMYLAYTTPHLGATGKFFY